MEGAHHLYLEVPDLGLWGTSVVDFKTEDTFEDCNIHHYVTKKIPIQSDYYPEPHGPYCGPHSTLAYGGWVRGPRPETAALGFWGCDVSARPKVGVREVKG